MTPPQTETPSDDRFVPPRCDAVFTSDKTSNCRLHRCTFREGHVGLHYSDRHYDCYGETVDQGIMRWGSDPQLYEEIEYVATPQYTNPKERN